MFKIDILDEIKLFDLLYIKETNKDLEKLGNICSKIKQSIDNYDKLKSQFDILIQIYKQKYYELIDLKIKESNELNKKCMNRIEKIKKYNNDIDKLVEGLKSYTDLENFENVKHIQLYIDKFNKLTNITIPKKIKPNLNSILDFKGNFEIMGLPCKIINLNKKESNQQISFLLNSNIIIILENDKNKNYEEVQNPFMKAYLHVKENEQKEKEDNNKEKIKITIIYNSEGLLLNKKKPIPKNYSFFLLDKDKSRIYFDEIDSFDSSLLYKSIISKFDKDNSQKDRKFFKSSIDLDKLYSNEENIDMINTNNDKKIELSLNYISIF